METTTEMPKYQCHKQVWAHKIAKIEPMLNPDPTGMSGASSYGSFITPAEDGFTVFVVDADFVNKHQPVVGGYIVIYEDGYKSFSPAQAFESGYTRL